MGSEASVSRATKKSARVVMGGAGRLFCAMLMRCWVPPSLVRTIPSWFCSASMRSSGLAPQVQAATRVRSTNLASWMFFSMTRFDPFSRRIRSSLGRL